MRVFRAMEDTTSVLCEHSLVSYVQSDIEIQHFYRVNTSVIVWLHEAEINI
jgi:hypothetical protein